MASLGGARACVPVAQGPAPLAREGMAVALRPLACLVLIQHSREK